ncbi:MAG: hypothetical protein EU543_03300 [Promethearchaeota archaeon]|nr:MAG: hypothetical protein EU543_03300 [Candidatus Lokiarchaeota archaeon]
MSELQKFNRIARIMIIVEILIFFGLYVVFLWLKSILVGPYYILFIISLIVWIIAIVITLMIYNKTNNENSKNDDL